jgi:hypothetical protein
MPATQHDPAAAVEVARQAFIHRVCSGFPDETVRLTGRNALETEARLNASPRVPATDERARR